MSFILYRDFVQVFAHEPSNIALGAQVWQSNTKAFADAIINLQESGGGGGDQTLDEVLTNGNITLQSATFGGLTIQTSDDDAKPFLNLFNLGAGGKNFSIGSTNNDSCEGSGMLSIYNQTDGGWPMLLDGAGNVTFEGSITGTVFYGDGSQLSNLPSSSQWTNIDGGIEYTGGDVFIGGDPDTNNVIRFSSTNQFFGIYDSGSELYLGVSKSLPAPEGTATVGGYFQGMGIGGATANTSNPIFGVLNSEQEGSGLSNVAFTVLDNNYVCTFNNILDDGSGVATFDTINVTTVYEPDGYWAYGTDGLFFAENRIIQWASGSNWSSTPWDTTIGRSNPSEITFGDGDDGYASLVGGTLSLPGSNSTPTIIPTDSTLTLSDENNNDIVFENGDLIDLNININPIPLTDEDGNPLTDENGNILYYEGDPPIACFALLSNVTSSYNDGYAGLHLNSLFLHGKSATIDGIGGWVRWNDNGVSIGTNDTTNAFSNDDGFNIPNIAFINTAVTQFALTNSLWIGYPDTIIISGNGSTPLNQAAGTYYIFPESYDGKPYYTNFAQTRSVYYDSSTNIWYIETETGVWQTTTPELSGATFYPQYGSTGNPTCNTFNNTGIANFFGFDLNMGDGYGVRGGNISLDGGNLFNVNQIYSDAGSTPFSSVGGNNNIFLNSGYDIRFNGSSDNNWRMGILNAFTSSIISQSTALQIIVGQGHSSTYDGFAVVQCSGGNSIFEARGYDYLSYFRGRLLVNDASDDGSTALIVSGSQTVSDNLYVGTSNNGTNFPFQVGGGACINGITYVYDSGTATITLDPRYGGSVGSEYGYFTTLLATTGQISTLTDGSANTSVDVSNRLLEASDGTIIFDWSGTNGGVINLSQITSGYSAIDVECGLFLHGNNIQMNNDSGSGGGNIDLEGGLINNVQTITISPISYGTDNPLLYFKQYGNDYGYRFTMDNEVTGDLFLMGVNDSTESTMITFNRDSLEVDFAGSVGIGGDLSSMTWQINSDGSVLFSGGNFTIDSYGNLYVVGESSLDNGNISTDGSGNITTQDISAAAISCSSATLGTTSITASSLTNVGLTVHTGGTVLSIALKELSSNVATLVTTGGTFSIGEVITVSGVDSTFDGTYTVTGVSSGNSFTYDLTASDVGYTECSGSAYTVQTSDLQQWKDINGNVLASISVTGTATIENINGIYPTLTITDSGGSAVAGTYQKTGISSGQPEWTGTSNIGNGIIVAFSTFLNCWIIEDTNASAVWNNSSTSVYGGYTPNNLNASGDPSISLNPSLTISTPLGVVQVNANVDMANNPLLNLDAISGYNGEAIDVINSDLVQYDGNWELHQDGSASFGAVTVGGLTSTGVVKLGTFTVSTLPSGTEAQTAYATDGRKVGELTGFGTGVPVYYSNGQWRVYSTDAQVQS